MTLLNNVITLYSEEVRLKLTELQKRTSNKQIQTKRKFDKVNVAEFRKRIKSNDDSENHQLEMEMEMGALAKRRY